MYVFVPKYILSIYALQILDFTLNMPHEFLGPVAPPAILYQEYPPPPPPPPGHTPFWISDKLPILERIGYMNDVKYCRCKATVVVYDAVLVQLSLLRSS